MPLELNVLREGESRQDIEWTWNTMSAIYTAAIKDSRPDWEYADGKTFGAIPEGSFVDFSMTPVYYLKIPRCGLVQKGEQTLKRTYSFTNNDGETWLTLERGDVLTAWRSSK